MNLAAQRVPSNLFEKQNVASKAQKKVIKRVSSVSMDDKIQKNKAALIKKAPVAPAAAVKKQNKIKEASSSDEDEEEKIVDKKVAIVKKEPVV